MVSLTEDSFQIIVLLRWSINIFEFLSVASPADFSWSLSKWLWNLGFISHKAARETFRSTYKPILLQYLTEGAACCVLF